MPIALVGADGQLAFDLQKSLPMPVVPLGRSRIDVTSGESVTTALNATRPDLVVNASAYNAVDRAEDDPQLAFSVNALGPRNLALWCARAGVPLVHFSTDHVFSGTVPPAGASAPRPFAEDDLPDPPSVYATTKLAGEQFVRTLCPHSFVLRTCGLYGMRPTSVKGNFVQTMLRLGKDRAANGQPLAVVADHVCTPTSTADLAAATADLISTASWGLYHATNAGQTNWHDFAVEIFRLARISVTVVPTTLAAVAAAARRPHYSVLNCDRLTEAIGRRMPPWQDALAQYLSQTQAK